MIWEILDKIPPFLWRVFGAYTENYARKQGMQSAVDVTGKFCVIDRETRKIVATTSGAAVERRRKHE